MLFSFPLHSSYFSEGYFEKILLRMYTDQRKICATYRLAVCLSHKKQFFLVPFHWLHVRSIGHILGCATWTWHENGCWLHKSPKNIPATPCGDGSTCVSGDNGITPLPPTPPPPPPPPTPLPPAGKDAVLLLPSTNHLKFHADNIGAIIHFNMQTMVPHSARHCCQTWNPSVFNPVELDTDQWLESISSFGGKYAIFVVDHFSGFAPYPTAQHNYSVAHSEWMQGKGDVVKDFVASCAKYKIRPGFYYSVHENWYANVSSFTTPDPGTVIQLNCWFAFNWDPTLRCMKYLRNFAPSSPLNPTSFYGYWGPQALKLYRLDRTAKNY